MSTHLRLIDNVSYGTSREGDSGDPYDGNDTWEEHDPQAFEIVKDYGDVVLPSDVRPGDEVYLVYAIYNTGDSFSHQDGCLQIIDAFVSQDAANACRELAEKYDPCSNYDYSFEYANDVGAWCRHPCAWLGYFESLTGIYIKKLMVRK